MRKITLLTIMVAAGLVASAADPDLNGDGKVNRADYSLLATALVSGTYTAAYDLNSDGLLDAVDANLLLDQIPPISNETFTVNGVSFTMVAVEGGTFTMGASSEQGSDAYDDEKPTHQVTLSDFSIGETEVTEGLWTAVMGSNPSNNKKGDNYPVEYVTWNDCQTFIAKLNELTGEAFRLPTEAEWEFAARGGTQSQGYKYSGSNTIGDVAWYYVNAYNVGSSSPNYGKHPVATKAANELGLYDMSGNVWEWCQDWYGSYSGAAQTDPTGSIAGSSRVKRGGSWYYNAGNCRVSCRSRRTPSYRSYNLGLRLAR